MAQAKTHLTFLGSLLLHETFKKYNINQREELSISLYVRVNKHGEQKKERKERKLVLFVSLSAALNYPSKGTIWPMVILNKPKLILVSSIYIFI